MDFEDEFEEMEVDNSYPIGHIKHGDDRKGNRATEYRSWEAIKRRCTNPKDPAFKKYGGRGILMYEGWINSYPAFLSYMGRKPNSMDTVERIDNNKGYFPGNVKWGSKKEQAENRSTSLAIIYDDRTQCLTKWCDELGLDYNRTKARLQRGWTPTEAFEVGKRDKQTITFEGETLTVKAWSERFGINYDKLRKRLQNGWEVGRAFEKIGEIGEMGVKVNA